MESPQEQPQIVATPVPLAPPQNNRKFPVIGIVVGFVILLLICGGAYAAWTMGVGFFIATFAVIALYVLMYTPIFLYRLRRDKLFKSIAMQYNLKLTLDYKQYSYWGIIRQGETCFLRTLVGTLYGKNISIQDRLRPLVIVSNRIIPVYFWSLIYFAAPISLFGYGAQTVISVDGNEQDISEYGFWSIFSLAKPETVQSVLKALN